MIRLVLTILLAAVLPGVSAKAADQPHFKSPAAALAEGVASFKRGDYERAVPALEFAAANDQFMAQYTLAEIYADNNGTETDHAKAYMLFQTIADEHSDVDPDDDRRAPYVAKALTALAGYLQVGLPEIGVKPDPARAADYLHHAALFFGNEDAQFELVKLKLSGEGVPENVADAKHWLAVLSQRGHPGAQAFLADLYWRGKFMEVDKIKAFALISVAVEHAPPRERIWIEDVYQNIFCGAGEGIRKQATGLVADWRARYGRRQSDTSESALEQLYPQAVRTCRDGDHVIPVELPAPLHAATTPRANATTSPALSLGPGTPITTGTVGGLREAGSRSLESFPTPGIGQGFTSSPSSGPH